MGDAHVALIIEDDLLIAGILKGFVVSLGHVARHVTTLEEVRAAIATGGYCYVLLDMQIPADATSDAAVGCGETALRLLRRADPRRNANDKHVVQILVVTAYSRELDFVCKLLDAGADDFIPKPFGDRHDLVLDRIRAALAKAGRGEHEACVAEGAPVVRAVAPAEKSAPPAAGVRIAIDGGRTAGRTEVWVNGARASIQDRHFVVFLHMVVALIQAPGSWPSAAKLGMARNAHAPSRIRGALQGVFPEGFAIVETQKGVGFRLNPGIEVERVEWGALREHPQAAVRKLAAEWGRGAAAGVPSAAQGE